MTRPTSAMRRSWGAWILGAALALSIGFVPSKAVAQDTGVIVGTITDAASGRALESAQVFIQGTGIGALTNAAGRYLLVNVPAGPQSLRVQLVGYREGTQSVTVTPGESTVADIAITQTAIELDEIVVTGAGVATEKKRLGNTIATIDVAATLDNAPISDFSSLISGREPGLVGLPSSGTTGEGARIRIRGSASLSQNNEPIVYVDGIRVDKGGGFANNVGAGGQGTVSRLDDIDPESIERIEVLKGAAAATLYGTEASNGVIQIFTKRGQQGAPRWTFQVEQTGIQVPTDRMLDLADYARDDEQLARMRTQWNEPGLQLFQPIQRPILQDAFNTGYNQTYSASVQGGTDLMTYFVSGRYFDEDGPWEGYNLGPATDTNNKIQANANIQVFPMDNLRIRFSSLYSEVNQKTPENSNNIRGAFSSLLMSQLRLATPSNLFGQPAFSTFRENLFQLVEDDAEHFAGSVNANWQLTDEVVFDATFGLDVVNQQSENFQQFGWNVDGFSTSVPEGQKTIGKRNHREITADFKASWNTQFTENISSTFLAGAQGFITQTVQSGGSGQDFPGPGLEVAEAGAVQSITESWLRVVNAGGYLQEQLGWSDWAFLTLGGRWDANSAFGEEFNTAFYPKASLSVVPSDYFDWESTTFSTFRIRAAVGQSGLQPGAFDQLTTFSPLPVNLGPGLQPENLGNPALQPEVSTEYELGSEVGLFNDRAAVDVTYWNRTVSDALVARQFPVTGGFRATQLDNIGEMKAWGLEIAANGAVVQGQSFSLNVFANASYLNEEITDMGGAPPIKSGGSYSRYRNFLREGFAPGSFFGSEVQRDLTYPFVLDGANKTCVEPSEAEVRTYFSQPRNPGDFEALEIGCVPGGAANLETFLGKPTPDWQGSLGFNISFLDNWELASLFEYKFGNYQVQDLSGMFRRANPLIGRNTPESARVGAILENPNSSADERIAAAQTWIRELRALAPMAGMNGIYDADWMRWRELSLTYRVPTDFVERLRLNTATLNVGVRNLKLWVKEDYPGMDPEGNVLGRCSDSSRDCNWLLSTEGWGIPIPRRFTFSARIGF